MQALKTGEWAMNIFDKLDVKTMYVELLPLYSSLYDEWQGRQYRYHDEYLPTFTIIGPVIIQKIQMSKLKYIVVVIINRRTRKDIEVDIINR